MSNNSKEAILFLVHRIPFPPNKGDKIRSYHLLQFLLKKYDVFLGTFIDAPEDENYRQEVSRLCQDSFFESIKPIQCKLKSLTGLLSGQALSIPYYSSTAMQQWVDNAIKKYGIRKVLLFSSPMAQFVEHHRDTVRVMDFVDIDSDKWQQYCKSHRGIMRWIYSREAEYLLAYERKIARAFDASLFVSEQEASLFKDLCPEAKSKVYGISNGVNIDFFSPEQSFESPYEKGKKVLVFTGAMDYWANCDAVKWFANEVFAKLYQQDSQYEFYIVGSNPTAAVKDLGTLPGITVTGRVDDVRPYIKHAFLAVAPLRIARGIQNKVLEAMSMGKIVMATENAMEGIQIPSWLQSMVTNSASTQVELIKTIATSDKITQMESDSRQWIVENYSWTSTLKPLEQILKAVGNE